MSSRLLRSVRSGRRPAPSRPGHPRRLPGCPPPSPPIRPEPLLAAHAAAPRNEKAPDDPLSPQPRRPLRAAGALVPLALLVACGGKPAGAAADGPPTTARFSENGVTVALSVSDWQPSKRTGTLTAVFAPEAAGFHLYSTALPPTGIEDVGRPTAVAVTGTLAADGPLTAAQPVRPIRVPGGRLPGARLPRRPGHHHPPRPRVRQRRRQRRRRDGADRLRELQHAGRLHHPGVRPPRTAPRHRRGPGLRHALTEATTGTSL
ncbi:hypothetical protein [Streptomyces lavendulae]|uniref:hypothetical protein n=1 Tax=Streptomyces lavendulae TaxID=1914 RepID=UPI0024A3739A|nr:hypothetical protein [Streptomyces lavendulae]GLW03456.1 hypothetical protein Slala05_70860 [Streptomyces lavendulae subsp. lavendulae]